MQGKIRGKRSIGGRRRSRVKNLRERLDSANNIRSSSLQGSNGSDDRQLSYQRRQPETKASLIYLRAVRPRLPLE